MLNDELRKLTPYERYKLRHPKETPSGPHGHGGSPGTGPKPNSTSLLHGSFNAPETPDDANDLLDPPDDLCEDEAAAWCALAPAALAEGTLTPSRVAGFRLLCQRWAYCRLLNTQVRVLGVTTSAADKLMRQSVTWQRLLSASLGEFALHSFGRNATTAKPVQTNAWTDVAKAG